jgi:hypothetical protein
MLPNAARFHLKEGAMSNRAVLAIALVTPILMFAVPIAAGAAEESPFLLQDDGTVRVLRGLNPDQNFQAATLPEDLDLAPAAAPPAEAAPPQIEPPRPSAEPGLTTRQRALRRAKERGIPVIRTGARRAPGPQVDSSRQRALERVRERGITVNRAGG